MPVAHGKDSGERGKKKPVPPERNGLNFRRGPEGSLPAVRE